MWSSKTSAVVGLVALGVFVSACEERKPKPEPVAPLEDKPPPPKKNPLQGVTDTTIKVGSFGPLSGPASAWGVVLQAMDAYFKYVNEQGGIHGRKIEFVYRDDQYSPAKTPGVVRELVEKEGVFAIVGGVGTANGKAVADYLESKEVPFFTPASGDRFWTDPATRKDNVFTVYPRYFTEGAIMGEYIAKNVRSLKVGVLYQDDDFGKQGAEGLVRGLQRFGGDLVVRVPCLPTDTDMSAQVSRLAKNMPEVLVIFSAPRQAAMMVKALAAQKKKPHILTSFVLADESMFKTAGSRAWDGVITSSVNKLSTENDPSVKKYREILKKYQPNLRPGAFTMAGFAFAMPFVEALHRAGPNLNRRTFYDALKSIKSYTGGGPYWEKEGLGPPITFSDDDRLGVDKIFFAKAVRGRWVRQTDWLSMADVMPAPEP